MKLTLSYFWSFGFWFFKACSKISYWLSMLMIIWWILSYKSSTCSFIASILFLEAYCWTLRGSDSLGGRSVFGCNSLLAFWMSLGTICCEPSWERRISLLSDSWEDEEISASMVCFWAFTPLETAMGWITSLGSWETKDEPSEFWTSTWSLTICWIYFRITSSRIDSWIWDDNY